MVSSIQTTCPKCGYAAHWHADDGLTWCENPQGCGGPQVAAKDINYIPPQRRGEIGLWSDKNG